MLTLGWAFSFLDRFLGAQGGLRTVSDESVIRKCRAAGYRAQRA